MPTDHGSLVLSALEFDVLWAAHDLPRRHPALNVPSPGRTRAERAELVEHAWTSLAQRRLARGRRATGQLTDMLHLLARPQLAIDAWVWADREIRGRACTFRGHALLAVIDAGEVWLIPSREDHLAQAAVSVAGDLAAGLGQTVSIPHKILQAADAEAQGNAKALVTALEDRNIPLWQAQELSGMLLGQEARGQFGAEHTRRDGTTRRAPRVIAFHDTDAGRYLFQLTTEPDNTTWATITPADNTLIAARVQELLSEA